MATTFLTATNEILKELNEVELSASNFSAAVGIHSFAKDIINRAYMDIVNAEEEWPFLIQGNPTEPFTGSLFIETVIGQKWYLLNSGSADVRTDFKSVDWDNFYLTDFGVAGAVAPYTNENLKYLSPEQYNMYFREQDNESVTEGTSEYNEPNYITKSSDNRHIGLSPVPDQVYRVYFNAWLLPTRLVTDADEMAIPDRWMNVIYARARYYMWQFKESPQQAGFALSEYNDGIKLMRRNLIDSTPDDMMDSRVVFI